MKPVIVLIGLPGSGKGTHGALLSKALNVPHISTGDLIRQEMAKETDLGQQLSEYVVKGEMAPASLTDAVILNRFRGIPIAIPGCSTNQAHDCDHGFILDGYPRTIEQLDDVSRLFAIV